VDRIRELWAELEFERRMRRKAETLVMELVEERRRGETQCPAPREEAIATRVSSTPLLLSLATGAIVAL
jgi:hypothetical protein